VDHPLAFSVGVRAISIAQSHYHKHRRPLAALLSCTGRRNPMTITRHLPPPPHKSTASHRQQPHLHPLPSG
jgi:hypothetical protein